MKPIFTLIALAAAILSAAKTVAADFSPTSFGIVHIPTPASDFEPMSIDLSTDKCAYAPGDAVTFTASQAPYGAKVRYRNGLDIVEQGELTSKTWQWTPPSTDFQGYLAEVYATGADGSEVILGTIAVDVSSDWTMYPRYGFIATFDDTKLTDGVVESEMDYLNRCHINGVQFQDWHWKHHWPLAGTRDNPMDVYTDIANRTVYASVVKKYIDEQHKHGMKAMFYNLAFGALDGAETDYDEDNWSVEETKYLYIDKNHTTRDYHALPSGWKSNIYLTQPGNYFWIEWMKKRNDDVYYNFDFDGYQIDQLGYRGTRYDYWGEEVDLPTNYVTFINGMKEKHPQKRLVMNAVSSYGGDKIVATGKVDFAYNETWDSEKYFLDLRNIIGNNDAASNYGVRTVFASYLNYNRADRGDGYMNTPGVLLTDAVMIAIGGNHLELGDHMLSREYFPASPLKMSDELREAMIRYYDFLTAYEQLLRGSLSTKDEIWETVTSLASETDTKVNNWPPQTGGITVYERATSEGTKIYHLLNFSTADNVEWCDTEAVRPEPREMTSLPIQIACGAGAKKVWTASPDYLGGAPQELAFTSTNDGVSLTVPSLKYLTMIVVEF